jgi:hypothetical protein
MAPYSSGAWRQHISSPVHLDPIMARAGTFTSSPWSALGPRSTARVLEVSRLRSHIATRWRLDTLSGAAGIALSSKAVS